MSAQVSLAPVYTAESISYQQLDRVHALRGFCAFYVVIYHAKYVLWSGGTEFLRAFPRVAWKLSDYFGFALAMTSSAGYEMVIFFFVLSGFFIRYATVRKPRPLFRFYLNRIVRIYPPYLASLVIAALVLTGLAVWRPDLLSFAPGRELNTNLLNAWRELCNQTTMSLAKALVFTSSGGQLFGYNNVYWSLFPEAIFYLLVPLVFRQAKTYYVVSALLFVVGTAADIRQVSMPPILSYLVVYNAYFALGGWLYDQLVKKPAYVASLYHANGLLLALVLSGLLVTTIALAAVHVRSLSVPLAGVLALLSITLLLSGRISRQNILLRVFHKIGLFSFSLYLYHFPLLLACYALLTYCTGSVVIYSHWFWLFVPIVTLGSYALYQVTERPAVQYFRGV